MSTGVLLPALIRPGLHPELRQAYLDGLGALAIRDDTIVVDGTEWLPAHEGENYWGRFARMRQAMVDAHLTDRHGWVLWIDADVAFEPDLFVRLLASSPEPAIVGAFVTIGGSDTHYDTAGTRPTFDQRGPSELEDRHRGIVPMFSVGACVLVPAEVHRQVRFEAQADEDTTANTEWTSLAVGARALGFPVLWNTDVRVQHAHLPSYGEAWH